MGERDMVQLVKDAVMGVLMLALGAYLARVVFWAYQSGILIRIPTFLASLLLVLYGIIILLRAGLPRESTPEDRARLGRLLAGLGALMAFTALLGVQVDADRTARVIVASYVSGFLIFALGGWLALVSEPEPEIEPAQN